MESCKGSYKSYWIFLNCFFSFIRIFRCIIFTILLRSDDFIMLIVLKHRKYDVTDFMNNCTDNHIFHFDLTFICIVIMDDACTPVAEGLLPSHEKHCFSVY